jgi:hypothetical protein
MEATLRSSIKMYGVLMYSISVYLKLERVSSFRPVTFSFHPLIEASGRLATSFESIRFAAQFGLAICVHCRPHNLAQHLNICISSHHGKKYQFDLVNYPPRCPYEQYISFCGSNTVECPKLALNLVLV